MLITYIGLFIIVIYTIIMCLKIKRIPTSISATYYLGGNIWFTIVMFIAGFCITGGLLNLCEGSAFQFIAFLTGAGIVFVGGSPLFRDELEGKIHYAGAITLLVGSQVWLGIFSIPWVFLFWIPSIIWIFTSKRMFWCEITCITTILIGLLYI